MKASREGIALAWASSAWLRVDGLVGVDGGDGRGAAGGGPHEITSMATAARCAAMGPIVNSSVKTRQAA